MADECLFEWCDEVGLPGLKHGLYSLLVEHEVAHRSKQVAQGRLITVPDYKAFGLWEMSTEKKKLMMAREAELILPECSEVHGPVEGREDPAFDYRYCLRIW